MCLLPKGGTECTIDRWLSPWRHVVVLSFSTARWMSKGKPPKPSLREEFQSVSHIYHHGCLFDNISQSQRGNKSQQEATRVSVIDKSGMFQDKSHGRRERGHHTC